MTWRTVMLGIALVCLAIVMWKAPGDAPGVPAYQPAPAVPVLGLRG